MDGSPVCPQTVRLVEMAGLATPGLDTSRAHAQSLWKEDGGQLSIMVRLADGYSMQEWSIIAVEAEGC